jgi:hypothetical protein
MKNHLILLFLLSSLVSCNRAKEKTKAIVNKGGELIGETASEFVEGVSEGVEKVLERKLSISDDLNKKGFTSSKVLIENDSLGNSNNVLVVYAIFEKDFNEKITAKIIDKQGLEIGRSIAHFRVNKGESKYCEFIFEKRSYIDVKSNIILELF